MIIVKILGGLGNQMFQYAYAKALSLDGYDVKLNLSKIKKYKLHGGYQLEKYKIDLEIADSFSILLGEIGIKKSKKEKSSKRRRRDLSDSDSDLSSYSSSDSRRDKRRKR